MRTDIRLTQDIYKKNQFSSFAKLRHKNTVIKPSWLYSEETLVLNHRRTYFEVERS